VLVLPLYLLNSVWNSFSKQPFCTCCISLKLIFQTTFHVIYSHVTVGSTFIFFLVQTAWYHECKLHAHVWLQISKYLRHSQHMAE
jgi:hypothetical protein